MCSHGRGSRTERSASRRRRLMVRGYSRRVRLAVVVSFLNEARYLPTLLASMARQTRPPDVLLLVDDGSEDESAQIAEAFAAEHGFARVIRRPPRPRERD